MGNLVEIGKRALDPSDGVPPSETASSDLELLFGLVAQALDQQDFQSALRLADRARRIASKNAACTLLYSHLLVKAGFTSQALDYLSDKDSPDIRLVRGLALLERGLLAEASEPCEYLLKRFSVEAVEGLPLLASRLCRAPRTSHASGWIGIDNELNLVGEVPCGSGIDLECSEGNYSPLKTQDLADGWMSFVYAPPSRVCGPVIARADGRELLGSGLSWPPEFNLLGWVALEGKTLVGEAQLSWSPELTLMVEISGPGNLTKRSIPVTHDGTPGTSSFSSSLSPSDLKSSQIDVVAVLPGGSRVPLMGSPVHPQARTAAKLEALPHRTAASTAIAEREFPSTNSGITDVIIPVYGSRRETLDCIKSVLRSIDPRRMEIVVVDDASNDPDLSRELDLLAADHKVTVLANPINLGFAGAVNRGIRLHPDRDVVLLNSDTQVFGDWVDRLIRAACQSADIGTVTPLGQNGSITDYSQEASLKNASIEEIDLLASATNAGGTLDIPVAVGFCMYIKRACLDQTGELDEVTFRNGYGEETDFSLRARNLGWRHVAATDVFVGHHGGRSFGHKTRDLLKKRSDRVLNSLYPGYTAFIDDFCAADPLFESRRAIDMARLKANAEKPVLLITHDLFGGVERHIGQRAAELSADHQTALILQRSASAGATPRVSLTVSSLGLANLDFDAAREKPLLEQLLRDIRLSHIELHHFLRLPPEVLKSVTQLNVPYDVYVHDYAWICPRVKLVDGSGRYCGEPELSACEKCVQTHGSAIEESITVEALRNRSAGLLNDARKVIGPSTDALERFAKHFPEQRFELSPWESVANSAPQASQLPADRLRVAVIGAIGVPKGYDLLLECARDAAARNLNLEFVVVGYTIDDHPLMDTGRVFVTGPYEEDEVATLLDRENCQMAFFPSVWPETWCYSLTHAIRHGLPIVALGLGAQAERLRAYPRAELLPLSLNAQQVNYALLQCYRKFAESPQHREAVPLQAAADEQQDSPYAGAPDLVSSVQVLNFPEGVYSFTVKAGGSVRDGSEKLALPALQVGVAPSRSSGHIEFLTGSSTVDRWLAYKTDSVVVRILGGEGSLLFTSVHNQDSPSLAVDVERLNVQPGRLVAEEKDGEDRLSEPYGSLPVRLKAHIRYVGDLEFGAGRAGWAGQKLWIEGFAISSIGGLPADCIEYRGLVANGLQTPWLPGEALCGSRGWGLPLLGFAVRVKAALAERYECSYSGRFLSGVTVGPINDGVLCSSDLPIDPLEAIEIHVLDRQFHVTANANVTATALYQ